MELEEKLKAKVTLLTPEGNVSREVSKVMPKLVAYIKLSDALSICQEAVGEAKIEALYDIRGYADFMDNTLIEILHNKIKELKEKL